MKLDHLHHLSGASEVLTNGLMKITQSPRAVTNFRVLHKMEYVVGVKG